MFGIEENIPIYGMLYNYAAVSGSTSANTTTNLCPVGWRVPTQGDFITLQTTLGGSSVAGGAIKYPGLEYWDTPSDGINSSGFNSLGGGARVNNLFSSFLELAYYWTTTPSFGGFNSRLTNEFTITTTNQAFGLSARCIKN
jgi:uncharacterized protein (TIGR02145 family)